MLFGETEIPGAWLIDIERHADERGFFARTWCRREAAAHGLVADFAQNSVSYNSAAGTLRGLHYQWHPHGEAKVVQCLRGAIFDVIVDLRPDSPSFGRWLGTELTADSHRMLFIPEHVAHGFQTLAADTEVAYMISAFHRPDAARGIRHDDPALGIPWPLPVTHLSAKDKTWPTFAEQRSVWSPPAVAAYSP